jgi:lysophospholipase L1-like esterase
MRGEKSGLLCSIPAESKQLIYTFIPNECGNNSRGYRGFEHELEKPAGTFRIVVIGDSVAEGHGVALDDTFPKIIERRLNDFSTDLQVEVEVITLARSGYTTSQELFVLEHEAFEYSPDLIVWSYVLNDPAHPYLDDVNPTGMYHYNPDFKTFALAESAYNRLLDKFKKRDCGIEYHASIHCAYWDEVEENIGLVASLADKNKVPVFFLINPVFFDTDSFEGYRLGDLHDQISDAVSSEGMLAIDATQAYLSFDPREIAQRKTNGDVDPWHPNTKGNQLLGMYLSDVILDAGVFQTHIRQ